MDGGQTRPKRHSDCLNSASVLGPDDGAGRWAGGQAGGCVGSESRSTVLHFLIKLPRQIVGIAINLALTRRSCGKHRIWLRHVDFLCQTFNWPKQNFNCFGYFYFICFFVSYQTRTQRLTCITVS